MYNNKIRVISCDENGKWNELHIPTATIVEKRIRYRVLTESPSYRFPRMMCVSL